MLIPSESPIHCKELPTYLGFVGEFLPEVWPAECALVPGHCVRMICLLRRANLA